MADRWEAVVVIEFPRLPGDELGQYAGDAPVDFANRAVCDRLKPALEKLLKELGGGGYVIKSVPSKNSMGRPTTALAKPVVSF